MTCSFRRGTVRVPADEEPSWADVASPIVPQTLVNWFAECSRLREVRGLELLDTSHAEHLSGLFRNCSSLAALRMPGVSPERADKIRMGAMFEGTDSLGDTPQHLVELVRSGTGVSIGNL